ncbi:MAG TPA: DUF4388 domain-containing protein [Thermodesulfobacteriota bacterium]|nr:DUF4388 domain-containing protein [Thermodesulfobacteriota bacterium]
MTQLAGNIEDLGLGEILQIICFSRKSGVLTLNSGGREGRIVFDDGNIVKATSSALTMNVGDVLVRNGLITAGVLEKAKAAQKTNGYKETIGAILIRDFSVPGKQVGYIATKLIERVVYSFFCWSYGSFVFELVRYDETPEIIKNDPLQHALANGLNPQFLAMEGSRLLDESKKAGASALDEEGLGEESIAIEPVTEEKEKDIAFDLVEYEAKPEPEPVTQPEPGLSLRDDYFHDILKEVEGEEYFERLRSKAPKVVESRGLSLLKEMLNELGKPLTLNEIVLLILRFSSELISRAVVFAVKKGKIIGLGQFGVEIKGEAADKRIKNINLPLAEDSILVEAIHAKTTVIRDEMDSVPGNAYLTEQLGGQRPDGAFAAPIVVQDKVAMIFYGDNAATGEKLGDISTLEIFLAQTSIALERIVLRKGMGKDRGAGN